MHEPGNDTGRGGVLRESRPGPAAASFASCVWVQEAPKDVAVQAFRVVPNGCVEITSELDGRAPVLRGPSAGPMHGIRAGGTRIVGVRFKPGGAASVFRAPAYELVGLEVPLDELWGSEAHALGERLAGAPSLEVAARTLENAVAKRMDSAQVDPLVGEAVTRMQPWRRGRLDELARDLYVSERQLRRRVLRAVGHSPKLVQRVLRIQAFLALVAARGVDLNLAWTAARLGYADQAHLTRECQALVGDSPVEFVRQASERCKAHDHGVTHAEALRALGARAVTIT
jgi:AraC-like DNA-binding protein